MTKYDPYTDPTSDLNTGQWKQYIDKVTSTYKFHDPEPNNIVLNAGDQEMLKVAKDGFYVRGVRVDQGPEEAQQVYEAFKQWLSWASLTRE